MNDSLINILNSVVANATPLLIAGLGETINERAGVINLSLDGSLALSAMFGFVAAQATGSLIVGLIAAAAAGMVVALIVAFAGIELRQDQVAIGFVLTLLCADLAQFLGQDYAHARPVVQMLNTPLPLLSNIPVIGTIFFNQQPLVYFSYILIFVSWYVLFHTRIGLAHRAVGERPEAAFARGTNVNRLRYLYTAIGGGLVGIAGASYSLGIKPGWTMPPVMEGDGWIALAIVIFGGWHPFRVVLGRVFVRGLARAGFGDSAQPGHSNPAGAAQRLAVGADDHHAGAGQQRRDRAAAERAAAPAAKVDAQLPTLRSASGAGHPLRPGREKLITAVSSQQKHSKYEHTTGAT